MIQLSMNKVRKTALFYIKNQVPFRYEVSLSSITVKSKLGSFQSKNNSFPAEELYFIKKVKNHITAKIADGAGLPHYKERSTPPQYFGYRRGLKPGTVYKNAYNVDIDSAYWVTAFKLGLIDENIFNEGMSVSKKTRLACIGTLAKKVSVFEYDGEKQRHIEDRIEPTAPLWDTICHYVADVIISASRAIPRHQFIFFWVDGIYVTDKSSAHVVQNNLKKQGYNSKLKSLPAIAIEEKNIIVTTGVAKEKVIDGKKIVTDRSPFHYSSSKNQI